MKLNGEVVEESDGQADNDYDDGFQDKPLLLELQENVSSPDQVTQVFEETVDITQLKEEANRYKELINEERKPKELEEIKQDGGGLDEMEEGGDDETVQDTIPEESRSGCSVREVDHPILTAEDHDDEVFSPVDQETFNSATYHKLIKDLNNSDNEWLESRYGK